MYQLVQSQKFSCSSEDMWNFISTPLNLNKITPSYMKFKILNAPLPEKMYEGMMIHYTVRPVLGIPVQWATEITHIKEGEYFVDEQRIGPFALWHHEHHLKPITGGFEMTDIVSYKPPFGFIGRIANFLFVKRQLNTIFNYRYEMLHKLFNENPQV
ncbi:MAG: hypothetical protein GC181_11200 [Bacteroidetes bacterium]|nr:hypothetical protein [Bacteroidota bacterium]